METQFDLFAAAMVAEASEPSWPPHDRFPANRAGHGVGPVVEADLLGSTDPLIVTGYTALPRLLGFLRRLREHWPQVGRLRLLFGHEPQPVDPQQHVGGDSLSDEMSAYWLARGISLTLCRELLLARELLTDARVEVRVSRHAHAPVHAKLYRGDAAVTLGSSNFSEAGLRTQVEANVRFTSGDEPERFGEACELGERLWERGRDAKADLLRLLDGLLRATTWPEALSRATLTLLEGEWAERYTAQFTSCAQSPPLWPSQRSGVAQALFLIETMGSVLVADATGSGKTRLGAALIRRTVEGFWASGRRRRDGVALVCPPAVIETWEAALLGQNVQPYSHGMLSQTAEAAGEETAGSGRRPRMMEAIRRAQVLAVDEAHNFLNPDSNRTRWLTANLADAVVLFTATPVNRGPQDLLAIVQLLGADNFDEATIALLRRLTTARGKGGLPILTEAELSALRATLQGFTVRRTKADLNRMIAADPAPYTTETGRPCRYPVHHAKTYPLGESAADCRIAGQIDELTRSLRGLSGLQSPFQLPPYLPADAETTARYVSMRLNGATGLARHGVLAALRSSRAALLERLRGTAATVERLGLGGVGKSTDTGNLIGDLADTIRGRLPENPHGMLLPDWLTDERRHRAACADEISIYEQIEALALGLSDAREQAKVALLMKLRDRGTNVLAFDGHLITLSDLAGRLRAADPNGSLLLATGNRPTERARAQQLLDPEARTTGLIALCSDALSEGVNLQRAGAVVHLDMPSVVRMAEQRVGRVDRMNSPHAAVEVYWPDDAPPFQLRKDERFVARMAFVEAVLGSNLPLPETLLNLGAPAAAVPNEPANVLSAAEVIRWVAEGERDLVGDLADAFGPVRTLVEGPQAMVSAETYQAVRRALNATNRADGRPDGPRPLATTVSLVPQPADTPAWACFAVAGPGWGRAPRWVFFASPEADPETRLEPIADALRSRLRGCDPTDTLNPATHEPGNRLLDGFVVRLMGSERALLPRRKQRALEQLERILHDYAQPSRRRGSPAPADPEAATRSLAASAVLGWTQRAEADHRLDLSVLADGWLDLIGPSRYQKLRRQRSSRLLLLKDLDGDLRRDPLPPEAIRSLLALPNLSATPLAERVLTVLVGVPAER